MAQIITTTIQQKHGPADNWKTKNPVLAAGEFGAETNTHKFKIGDGTTAWKDLPYAGADEAQINALIAAAEDRYFSVVRNAEEEDNAAITRALGDATASKGDICVIKTALGTTPESYSFMGYVYDGANWGAMDGNVSSENIILSKDFVGAGDWTQIGNVKKSQTGTITIPGKGKNLNSFLENFTTEELNPTKPTPTCAITLTGAGAKEVGTTFTPAYTATFDKKAYAYPPTDTGVTVTAWEIKDTNDVTKTAATGSFDAFTVEETTNYKLTAKASYSDGKIPKTNLEHDYPAAQIKAGTTAVATSGAVTGYRNWFYGYKNAAGVLDVAALTSAQIRALTARNGSFPATIDTNGMQQMFFAIPKGRKTSVKCSNNVNGAPCTMGKTEVQVEGANGFTAIAYDVWYVNSASADSGANTYKIVVS